MSSSRDEIEKDIDWILTAPGPSLRAILLSLCKDRRTRIRVNKKWKAIQDSQIESDRIALCAQCNEAFREDDNKFGDCHYHPENLIPFYPNESWGSDMGEVWLTEEKEDIRRQWPGLEYPCCKKPFPAKGCKTDRHEAHPDRALRGLNGQGVCPEASRKAYESGFREENCLQEAPPPRPEALVLPPLTTATAATTATTTATAGVKRKAEDALAVCVLCESTFSEESNRPDACKYHPGELVLDEESDVWADCWDETGEWDTEDHRRDKPEGFTWECCHKDGTAPPCVTGRHQTEETHGKQRLLHHLATAGLTMEAWR